MGKGKPREVGHEERGEAGKGASRRMCGIPLAPTLAPKGKTPPSTSALQALSSPCHTLNHLGSPQGFRHAVVLKVGPSPLEAEMQVLRPSPRPTFFSAICPGHPDAWWKGTDPNMWLCARQESCGRPSGEGSFCSLEEGALKPGALGAPKSL